MNETNFEIKYITREQIDTGKWNTCIAKAANGLVYAMSFYLDIMAENWSALIAGDYDAIMPLTWNRKYGFTYLYQPAFTAQLGLFVLDNSNQDLIEKFIGEAKRLFKFCEIHLNEKNKAAGCYQRANYLLSLDKSYLEIRNNYKKRLLENLKEAGSNQVSYSPSDDFSHTIYLFEHEYGKRFPHVRTKHYQRFGLLCQEMKNRNMLFVRQVRDPSGKLLSSSIFFKDHRRIYNIMSVTLKPGREKRSHFYLIDQLIREFSPQNLVLDFEGSEQTGIAGFYKKFGSFLCPYPFLKFNNLPFPFRFFK
jgi:hypothetical protein